MECATNKDIQNAIFKNGQKYIVSLSKQRWRSFESKKKAELYVKKEISSKCLNIRKKVHMY